MCARLGVRHFTRHGVAGAQPGHRRATGPGPSTATTTRGWTSTATSTTSSCAVDTDHVPLPNFCRAAARLLPRPRRRLRRGSAGLRQHDSLMSRAGPSAAVPVPLVLQRAGNRHGSPCWSAPTTPCASPPSRTSTAWPTRSPRTWPPAWCCTRAATRPPATVEDRLHPGRARGRRGPVLVDRLLHPAAPLVPRHQRGGAAQVRPLCAGSSAVGRAVHYALLMSYYPRRRWPGCSAPQRRLSTCCSASAG